MILRSIEVTGFRNLSAQKLSLCKGLNLFVGQNAQGKTNLLESVYLCCLGRSARVERDKDMINWQSEQASVTAAYNSRYGEGKINVRLRRNGKKSISVNSIPILAVSELMGYLNAVYFSPDEMALVKMGPDERRRFVDIDLCQTDKVYFSALSRFNKALSQRNNLLKNCTDPSMLSIWNTQLAKEGARIIFKRKGFVQELAPIARKIHFDLSVGKEEFLVSYASQVQGEGVGEISDNYLSALETSKYKDLNLRYTSTGAQRDDLKLTVNNIDIRQFGSQGQARTAALSLKLAEVELLKKRIGEYPLLLLDDVLSELDISRQSKLLTFNKDVQTILTATHIDSSLALPEYKKFEINNGLVSTIQ